MNQEQHFWRAHRHIADVNNHLMELIRDQHNPLTSTDLYRLIERWPERYGRFRGLADTLARQEREREQVGR